MKLISPDTGKELFTCGDSKTLSTADGSETFTIDKGVVVFLEEDDAFYEGAYLNKIKFVPKNDRWIHSIPLWVINGGYMWQVKNTFSKNSVILELGCASGVEFFGRRFRMIGLDLSKASLQRVSNYQVSIQADASKIPLASASVDGIISSYFWEHIHPELKERMLLEFKRVLKPGGKMVFLYDVETRNPVIQKFRNKHPLLYKTMFLEHDGHVGYETISANEEKFLKHGFQVLKHHGMERTWLQSNSVWQKFKAVKGVYGLLGRLGSWFTSPKFANYVYTAVIRVVDESIGLLWDKSKARIVISVLRRP